ncbi:MAG: CHASE2 domain-containing protein, partial [Chthoniobacterales bacterium]
MLGTRRTAVFLISTLALAGVIALDRLEPDSYVGLRNLLRDTISRAGRTTAPNPQLVFLAIDSDSVGIEDGIDIENLYEVTDSASPEARALRLMSKHWPWPRDVYGMILDRLVQAGAKVVLFDLTFPTSTDGDEPFRLALEKYSNRVVIGSNFTSASAHAVSHTRPPDTLVPQTTPVDDRVAYTNFWPDDDDVVRRAQYRVTVEQANQTAPMADSERYLSLDARGLMKAGLGDRVPADLSAHVFRYTGPPRTGFPPHSIFEIFVPRFWKGNYHNGEFFRDKIVLVGAEGNWQHDEHSTPWGAMPGPELHLNAMNAAIQGEFIREVSHNVTALVALTAALLALGLSLWVRSPWVRVLCMIALDLADIWITLLAYNHFDVFIPCLPSLIPFNTIVLIGLISDFTFERVEKKRVRRALERYVSSNVVREMIDSPE